MKLTFYKNSFPGFTLIELLIVIALIGIIAGFTINTYDLSLKKGRDSQRKNDLYEIKTALNTYYQDNNKYPLAGSCATGNCGANSGDHPTTWVNLPSSYISQLPVDPINGIRGPASPSIVDPPGVCVSGSSAQDAVCAANNYAYSYVVSSNQQHFVLYARLENTNDLQACPTTNYSFPFNLSFGSSYGDCKSFVHDYAGEAGLYYIVSD